MPLVSFNVLKYISCFLLVYVIYVILVQIRTANSLTTDNNKVTLTFCMFYDSCMVTKGHFKFMMAVN